MIFRHELKHEITQGDKIALRSRLSKVMSLDSHVQNNGAYKIRSLYFDDIFDTALKEKLDGISVREKFRLRYYNDDTGFILLEKKSKQNGLCNKQQTVISKETVSLILKNRPDKINPGENKLLAELLLKMKAKLLRPQTIVDYEREPFVYAPGNVRVTLDYNIRTALRSVDFLNPLCTTVPLADNPVILEVKWDEYLPSVIRDVVNLHNRRTGAFSKYSACRQYD